MDVIGHNYCLLQVQRVIFLYKAVKGSAGASFGLNVAMMAGLPHAVVAKASGIAKRCKEKENNSGVSCTPRIQSDCQNGTTARKIDSELLVKIGDKASQALKAIFNLQESCISETLALQRDVASICSLELGDARKR
jgi:DNA mismatch repair ATPase MutS